MAFQGTSLGTFDAIGATESRPGRYEESAATLSRGAKIAAELCKRDPTNVSLRGDMMSLRFSLALSLTRADRHEEAVCHHPFSMGPP